MRLPSHDEPYAPAMTAAPELTTMTGPEAYAKAVEYASLAAECVERGYGDNAQNLAAVAQAYAAIATAHGSVKNADSPWWAA